MGTVHVRWVLAFDASCERCREMSRTVFSACDEKLEVLPLSHPDVWRWREQSLGSQAPWAPTLVRVQSDDVRAWIGMSIAIPLARHLGLRSTIYVLRSLGALHSQENKRPIEQVKNDTMGRLQFLKLGAGVALAAGIILSGQAPAFAEPGLVKARRWVEENRNHLPERYDDVIAHPVVYRKAIFSAQTPSVRSRLWVEHLKNYRLTNPGLTGGQNDLIDQALAIASIPLNFDFEQSGSNNTQRQLKSLEESVKAEFGADASYALIGTLGPSERPDAATADRGCTCSTDHDECNNSSDCYSGGCLTSGGGCGPLWRSGCDGLCQSR